MGRNDSVLYSGQSSKLENTRLKKEQRLSTKQEKRNKLTPVAEIVLDELDKEKEATQAQLLGTITSQTTDDQVKDLIVALNLYSESMSKLKNRFKNILRKVEIDEG